MGRCLRLAALLLCVGWAGGEARAAENEGDPWRVAEALLSRGRSPSAFAAPMGAPVGELPALRRYASDAALHRRTRRWREALAELPRSGPSRWPFDLRRAVSSGLEAGPSVSRVDVLLEFASRLESAEAPGLCARALLEAGFCAESLGWTSEALRLYEAGAIRAYGAGLLPAARELAVARTRLSESAGSPDQRVDAWIDEGAIQGALGNVAASRRALRQAHGEAVRLGRAYAEALAAMNLFMSYQSTHDFAEAERWGGAASSAIRRAASAPSGSPSPEDLELTDAGIRLGRGNLLLRTARAAAAIPFYEEALEVGSRLRDADLVARARGNLGAALVAAGESTRGIALLASTVEESRARGEPGLVARALGNLADGLRRAGDLDGAERRLREALREAEPIEDRALDVDLRQDLADVLIRRGRAAEAAAELEEVLRVSRLADYGFGVVRAWGGLVRAWTELAEPWQALACADAFCSALARGVDGLDDASAVSLRARYAEAFDAARAAALRIADDAGGRSGLDEVFFVLEGFRAAGLSDAFLRVGRAGQADPALEVEEDAARAEDRAAADALAAAFADPAATEADLQRLRTRRRLAARTAERLASRLAVERSKRSQPRADGRPGLDVLRARLARRPGAVLLVYSVRAPDPFALVISPGDVRKVPLPRAREALSAFSTPTAHTDPADAARALESARGALLAPLGLDASFDRAFVVPDEDTGAFPFPALLPTLAVTVLPRAGWLSDAPARPGTGPVIALADPETDLTRLPGSSAEASAVADQAWTGRDASESRLRAILGGGVRLRCLLLGAHVVLDPVDPYATGIALGPDGREDGRFTGREILSVDLRERVDLVVLSACQGAVGTVVRGEGVLGLHRAFLLAGAPRVLASLWKVDDAATARFMEAFFAAWNPRDAATREPTGTGVPAATALRLAQQAVREDATHPEWRHPKHWAAWVLWGLPE